MVTEPWYLSKMNRLLLFISIDSILTMLSTKYIEQLKAKWWPIDEYAKECDRYENAFDGLTHQNIIGFYSIILFGIASAVISVVFKFMRVKTEKRIIRALNFDGMLNNCLLPSSYRAVAKRKCFKVKRRTIDAAPHVRIDNSLEMVNKSSVQQQRRCKSS